MKKLALTTLVACALAGSAFAQGTVSLYANQTAAGNNNIAYVNTSGATVGVPVGASTTVGTYGALNVAIYSASVGTAAPFTSTAASLLPAAWVESTTVLHAITTAPGWTAKTTFTLPNASADGSGGPIDVLVVGWTGAFTSWNTAFAAGAVTGLSLFGWTGDALNATLINGTGTQTAGSLDWQQSTANSAAPAGTPVGLTIGANGFSGLLLTSLAPVPEPTSFALCGLGAAALLIFRRRK